MPAITYPDTKCIDVVETYFGQRISDPYRWLETDVRSDTDVAVWDLASDDWTPRKLIDDFHAEWSVIGNVGTKLFNMTSKTAERRKIVTLDLTEAAPAFEELVAQQDRVGRRCFISSATALALTGAGRRPRWFSGVDLAGSLRRSRLWLSPLVGPCTPTIAQTSFGALHPGTVVRYRNDIISP